MLVAVARIGRVLGSVGLISVVLSFFSVSVKTQMLLRSIKLIIGLVLQN